MRNFLYLSLLAAGLAALAACAPARTGSGSTVPPGPPRVAALESPAYVEALDVWVNHSEADLISAWGVPERSQRLTDGGQALEYLRTDIAGRLLCSTLFTSDIYGMIRTWTFRGVDCRVPHLGDYGAS